MKKIILVLIGLIFTNHGFTQILTPVKWKTEVKINSATEIELIIISKIDKGWHLYSQNIEDGGPIPTTFVYSPSKDFSLLGKTQEIPEAEKVFDKIFGMNIAYFSNEARFIQKIKRNTQTAFKVKLNVEFMVCDDKQCLPPETIEFTFDIPASNTIEKVKSENTNLTIEKVENNTISNSDISDTLSTDSVQNLPVLEKSIPTKSTDTESESLWIIFLKGFIGGFAALIMPCIFPMLPLTVSYFTKKGGSRKGAITQAGIYGAAIIVIYVALGTLVTLAFGSDALNQLASSAVFNLIFFAMLIIFAISFFGAFEITLPSSLVNSMDAKSDKSGIAGIFFMAFTLALVSFSCTGPIIGTLLVDAASSKALLGPITGMFGFSLALAIPFSLFAAFPQWLKNLPKSGGWLNSVKVVLGFLELAFAFKFLSNVDLAYHWGILDREVFLSIWIVIFMALGFYLLGKIQFAHDSEIKHLSVTRFFLALVALSFSVYMIPGLWGAPLKAISAFSPPQGTQDFDLHTAKSSSSNSSIQKKYSNLFHSPHNLDTYFDFDEGMEYAKKVGKPVLIDFTGHSCVNCRKMEVSVWSDPAVLQILRNDYVIISLYVDDKTELPENEKYQSSFSNKKINTVGQKWSDLQASKYNTNSQPYYVLLNHNLQLLSEPTAFDLDVNKYVLFLETGLKEFRK